MHTPTKIMPLSIYSLFVISGGTKEPQPDSINNNIGPKLWELTLAVETQFTEMVAKVLANC